MRFDAQGLFWHDVPTPPPEPCIPPPRTWERPEYLPGLEEAKAFNLPLMSEGDLAAAQCAGEPLVFDVEVYKNYALFGFRSIRSGRCYYLEAYEGFPGAPPLDVAKLEWILRNFLTVGFNSLGFDLAMATLALKGQPPSVLKQCTERIIVGGEKAWLVLRSYKTRQIQCDHIDLIEVTPLEGSLKLYGGRLHVPKMQDLPFHPDICLNFDQIRIVRFYCLGSDLQATAFLWMELKEQIRLRESLGKEYGIDLRSKSDAQIAEYVVAREVERLTGIKPERPDIFPGTVYQYHAPEFVRFLTPMMNRTLATVQAAQFVVEETGGISTPESLNGLEIRIGSAIYRMGIGGLHSSETCVCHQADAQTAIVDRDVASYYPAIVLNTRLFPRHIGPVFLEVYHGLVKKRLEAKKKAEDKSLSEAERRIWKIIADSLKITINGAFGKLGNKWSILYSPDLLIQVTITGQLALLMLIERIELAGIPVISGNTDGVIIKVPVGRREELAGIISGWERDTGFTTEETEYKAVYSRDVNNYIAVKLDGKTKVKGEFSEKGSAQNSVLSKNPENLICSDAVQAFLAKGMPLVATIRGCKDIRRFVTVRRVTGGAVRKFNGQFEYIGKAIRWYYAEDETGHFITAMRGSLVGRTEGAKPLMELPKELPADLNFAWYEKEAQDMLESVGWKPPVQATTLELGTTNSVPTR